MRIRAHAVTTILLCCVTLGACGDEDPPQPTEPTPSSDAAAPTTAKAALALGGLELPAEVSDLTFGTVDVPQNRETYVVTFTAPRASAVALCGTAGLGGDLPAVRLSEEDRSVLGEEANPEGARYCSSMWPESTSWNRTVLVEAGDPALVRIAVGRQSR